MIGLHQVRRLRRRGPVERGAGAPLLFAGMRPCNRSEHVAHRSYARLRGQIPMNGAPLPRCDVPCKGSSLSCLARLASIRTWCNARRVGNAELP